LVADQEGGCLVGSVSVVVAEDVRTSIFRPVAAIHDDPAAGMFDQLEAWVGALKPHRKTVSGGMSPTTGLDQRRL
jgi:hypothetical protein